LAGQVLVQGQDLYEGDETELAARRRRFGVMFQAGALWSAMSLGENIMMPMRLFTPWSRAACAQRARLKLALVGLDGSFDRMPSELSGGMRKRAALARALALDPALLFLDEPGSGLDPVNAARLDELILQLRDHLGTTVVMVTHEIDSVFAVADRVLFLDEVEKTMTALDAPQVLLDHGPPRVQRVSAPGAQTHDTTRRTPRASACLPLLGLGLLVAALVTLIWGGRLDGAYRTGGDALSAAPSTGCRWVRTGGLSRRAAWVSVQSIGVVHENGRFAVPVVAALDRERIHDLKGGSMRPTTRRLSLPALVERGLSGATGHAEPAHRPALHRSGFAPRRQACAAQPGADGMVEIPDHADALSRACRTNWTVWT
jgi:phospholipid/cholesterol/gamma-HCH transport system ATP-binding protein